MLGLSLRSRTRGETGVNSYTKSNLFDITTYVMSIDEMAACFLSRSKVKCPLRSQL